MATTIPLSLHPLSSSSPPLKLSTTTPFLHAKPLYKSLPQFHLSNCNFHLGISKRSPFSSGHCCSTAENESQETSTVEVLSVPQHWLQPEIALQESEWLRVTLHKWLDDEYCPEPTNVEISRVAADSYYRSLLQKTTDLGEILLKMVRELQLISYQESFHGAFSSANAAVNLIAERIERD